MAKRKRALFFLVLWIHCFITQGKTANPNTKLHCTATTMDLIVESLTHQNLELNLFNRSCKAVRLNNTHVFFQVPLTGCGTQHRFVGQRVVFFNWLVIKDFGQSQKSESISRELQHSQPFHCVYKKNDVAKLLGVFEPLNFDPSNSSPKKMVSLLGLPVKLQCTFRDGASPITVKFFKNQIMVAKVTHPSIQREIVMATKKDFGEYSCIATDREGNMARHNVTIKQIDRLTVPRDGVFTTCSASSFHVIMNRTMYPWLQPELKHMHLRDHACEARHINNTHIILNSSYDQCKTIKKESYGEVIYDNVFVIHVKPRDDVPSLDVPDIEFAVECRLKRFPKTRITVTPLDQGKMYHLNGELFGIYHHRGKIRAVCQTDPHERFIEWRRKPTARRKNTSKVLNRVLLIENITDSDGGLYLCITTRNILRFHFFVEAHSQAKSRQYIRKGRDGLVVCSVGGFPKVKKRWTKNGNNIEMKGRYSISNNGNLIIAQAVKKDGGIYSCEVEQVFKVPLRMKKFQERNIMVEVYEPLIIDRYKTSRKQINTFKGLKTNIICSFKHGATPLKITLTKNGQSIKSNGSVIRVQGKTLYALLETRDSRSFGKYECIAKDAVGTKLHYVMSLRKIGKNDILKNGIALNCYENYMDVTFSLSEFPFLDPKNYHIHLNSSNCEPYEFTKTHIRIQAPLKGCGTTLKQRGNLAIYHNSLIARFTKDKWRNNLINRVPDVVFPFKCAYENRIMMKQAVQVPIVINTSNQLKVNALRSSPIYVSSLLNIRLRLTCAFTGGVIPLKIEMIKDGKQVAQAQKVDERTLTAVVRARFSAVGKYECKAVDATGQTATHIMTLGITDYEKISKKGLSVKCDSHSINIALNRRIYSWIHPDYLNIHLVDQTCQPFLTDSTHVLIKTPLNSCGTSYKQTGDHNTYHNKLLISERTNIFRVVSWSPLVVFPIECKFERLQGDGLIFPRHT